MESEYSTVDSKQGVNRCALAHLFALNPVFFTTYGRHGAACRIFFWWSVSPQAIFFFVLLRRRRLFFGVLLFFLRLFSC